MFGASPDIANRSTETRDRTDMDLSLSDRLFRFNASVEAAFPPIGQFLTLAGKQVHYVRRGDPSDTPIVLIHGASGNVRDWELSILPGLSQHCDTIAFDRPGFGYSDALPDHGWKLTDQIAHLRAALGQLGVTRHILVGHSYGGSLAMRWALDHPQDLAGVVLISAPVMDWGGGGIGPHYHVGGRPVSGDVLAQLVRLIASDSYLRNAITDVFAPQIPDARYFTEGGAQLSLRPATFKTNSVMMLRLYAQMVEQAKRNADLSVPTQIIHGQDDTIVPHFIHAEVLARMHPKAGNTLMPGVGHMPHHADPEAVVEVIRRLIP